MKSVVLEKFNLDEYEGKRFPKVLYKYRNWRYESHQRFIKNREVFLASPLDFEDRFDCRIPIRYDLLNEKQAKLYYDNLIKLAEPNLNRFKRREKIKQLLKLKEYKSEVLNKKYQEEYFEDCFKRLGIFCLTENNLSEKMWDEYAGNQSGFCIGYNSKILFKYLGGGGKVKYVEELPKILPEPIMDFFTVWYNQIYVKLKEFEFEEEYRTEYFWNHVASLNERRIKIPIEAFNSIILGKNISDEHKNEINLAVRENIGDIPILNFQDL